LIGKKAPAFSLPDQTGTVRSLADHAGKWLVVYFYPKDLTEGCVAESCGFRDTHAEFAKLGVAVVGISILTVKSKAKFAAKHALNFPILADEDHSVAEAWGLWIEKSMYGRKYMAISRETFIVAPDGTIAMHWPKVVANEQHAVDVLEWLRANA